MQRWMQSAAGGTSQRLKPAAANDAFAIENARDASKRHRLIKCGHAFPRGM